VEHRPFHPAAAPIARDSCKLYKQSATITFPALLRLHEQILEIKARSSEPCGKIVKVNCEPDWRFLFKSEQHFRHRPLTKQHTNKLFFCCSDFVRRALVRSQIANELQNDRNVLHPRQTNLEISNLLHYSELS